MTELEKFEKWLNTLDKQMLVIMAAKQARTIEELQAAAKAAVPEGWKLVPVEPTPEMMDASDLPYPLFTELWKDAIAAAQDGDK